MVRVRRIGWFLLVAASLAAIPTRAVARYEGNVNLFIGKKWLSQSDWEPVNEQSELGIMLAFAPERAPIYFALDVLASEDNGTSVSPIYGSVSIHATTQEYDIGVRKVWHPGATQPFVGAGGCLIKSSLDLDAPGYRQSYGSGDYGGWIDAGITWRIGKHFNLGFEARYSFADARFSTTPYPTDVPVGGFHAGALLGYGW